MMSRWAAFLWSALAAIVCSVLVTIRVGEDPDVMHLESVVGATFLLAVSWAVAGIVLLLSRSKAQRLTLVIVSVVVSVAISAFAILLLAT